MWFRYKTTAIKASAILIGVSAAAIGTAYDLDRAAAETGLDREIIRAIAFEESQRVDPGNDQTRPWPWTLNVQGQGIYYQSRAEAALALRDFQERGITNIDIGAFQINLRWNGDLARKPEDLLDPRVNLWAFAQVIRECISRVGKALPAVLSCYHTGQAGNAQGRRYASRVLRRYQTLKEMRP